MRDLKSKSSLETIPGVGPKMAADLLLLGYKEVSDLEREDPEMMFERLMEIKGCFIDRCELYVFRCAVYYATREKHDPEKLKWWYWKD